MNESYSYLGGLQRNEEAVTDKVQATFRSEYEAVAAGLEQVVRGLQVYARVKGKTDQDLEAARVLLAIRSFSSLFVASQVLNRGYYQQALTAMRMAMEDDMVAIDAEQHPPTLQAVLRDTDRIGRGKLTYTAMAARISPATAETWKVDYGWVSKAAAHPRGTSLRGLVTLDENGVATLQVGPYYDEWEVTVCLYHLLRQIETLLARVGQVVGDAGQEWIQGAVAAQQEVKATWVRLDEVEGARMQGWRRSTPKS